MNFPKELKYTKTHEWVKKQAKSILAGITEYAQKELSDVVYVELPAVGKEVKQGAPCAVVESVKAAFDIYAPVSGKILSVNAKLADNPALINSDPYGEGWFFEIEPLDLKELERLLDVSVYEAALTSEAH